MFKKALSLLAALALVGGLMAGCSSKEDSSSEAPAEGGAVSGTFEGTANGYGGDVVATVTLADGVITNIDVVGENETDGIGSIAIDQLPAAIVAAQSTDIDGVASATVTSDAVFAAVEAALVAAGLDPADFVPLATESGEREEITLDVDVVVIGAGGAGMTAAITARQAGLNVVIFEKMPMVGGNTTKATGGMNVAESKYQIEQDIEDSIQTFIDDTMNGGYDVNNIELVTKMAESAPEAIEWLETIDAPLPKVSFSGGATNARIHAPEDGSAVGSYLVAAFSAQLEALDIPVYLNTKVDEIVMVDGAAAGVLATGENADYVVNATAVVLATGGFGANEDLYTQYKPELQGFVTTNTPGATGDGIVMAQAIGANLVDIEQIQIHPTVEQGTSIMITEGVRGDGAILVNADGERFTNELLTRDVVSANVIAQDGGFAWIIFDQNLRDSLGAIESYVKAGIVVEGATIEELAEAIEVDAETLANTLETWNGYVAAGADADFERATGMDHDLSVAPYYAVKIAPGVHHTMGGVEINVNTEVIDTDGNIIPGLFAAGEVTGGIHGGNRIGGNAVTDIVVFGRIAGENATAYVNG